MGVLTVTCRSVVEKARLAEGPPRSTAGSTVTDTLARGMYCKGGGVRRKVRGWGGVRRKVKEGGGGGEE